MSVASGIEDDIRSVSDSMSLMEEKQANIQALLDRLDVAGDSYETGNMISGMESLLDAFSSNQQGLQHEISDLLENSRHSAIAYEHLPDMVSGEMARSKFMTGMISSLKLQIESMIESLRNYGNIDSNEFNFSVKTPSSAGNDGDLAKVMSAKMDLMMKSVDGLNKIVASPVKHIQKTITTIDSEVVVLANKMGGNIDISDYKANQRPKPVQKSLNIPSEKSQDQIEREVGIPSSSKHHVPREIYMEAPKPDNETASQVSEIEAPPDTEPVEVTKTPREASISPRNERIHQKKHKKEKSKHEKKQKHEKSELKFKKRRSDDSVHSLHLDSGMGTPQHSISLEEMSQSMDRLDREIDELSDAGDEVSVASSLSMDVGSINDDTSHGVGGHKGKKGGKKGSTVRQGGRKQQSQQQQEESGLPPTGRSPRASSHVVSPSEEGAAEGGNTTTGGTRRNSRRNSKDRDEDIKQLNAIAEATANNERRSKELQALEKAIKERERSLEQRTKEMDDEVQRRVNTAMAAAKRTHEQQKQAEKERLEKEWMEKVAAAQAKIATMPISANRHEPLPQADAPHGKSVVTNHPKKKDTRQSPTEHGTNVSPKENDSGSKAPHSKTNRNVKRSGPSTSRSDNKFDSNSTNTHTDDNIDSSSSTARQNLSTTEVGGQVSLLISESRLNESPSGKAHSTLFDDSNIDSKIESKWEDESSLHLHSGTQNANTTVESTKSLETTAELDSSVKVDEKKAMKKLQDDQRRKKIEDSRKKEQERIIEEYTKKNKRTHTLLEFPDSPRDGDFEGELNAPILQLPTTPNGTAIRPFSAGRTKLDPINMMQTIFSNVKDPEKIKMIRINAPTMTTSEKGTSTALDAITDELATLTEVGDKTDVVKPRTAPPSLLTPEVKDTKQGINDHEDEKYKKKKSELRKSFDVAKSIMRRSFDKDTMEFLESMVHQSTVDGTPGPQAAHVGGYELPIYDNQGDILVTRTYRPPPAPSSFAERLYNSDTPLFTIAEEYATFLPSVHRTRLLAAAALEDKIKENLPRSRSLNVLLAALLENMLRVSADCDKMLKVIEQCEAVVEDLVGIAKANPDAVAIIASSVQMSELYRSFGNIDAIRISTELQMFEYRGLFEQINARGALEISALMKESSDFDYCYKFFIAAQGKIVETTQRLDACKKRCARHNLSSDAIRKHSSSYQHIDNNSEDGSFNSPMPSVQQQSSGNEKKLKAEILRLQDRLITAMEELEDQEVETLELMREKDRAPDALMFFALMHDPAYAQNLNQLLLQLKHLKPFVEGSDHVDFITLKKRIQVCVALAPSIQRLCDRYRQMYKKWSNYRLNWFSERNLTGGTADSFNSCPLCFQSIGAAAEQQSNTSSNPKKPKKKMMSRAERRKEENILKEQHETLRKEMQMKDKNLLLMSQQELTPQVNTMNHSKASSDGLSSTKRHQISLPSIS